MLKTSINIDSLKKIDQYIERVNKMMEMQTDHEFQKYIQKKCFATLQTIMDRELTGGTSNDEEITLYKNSNHISEEKDGFIIYNDAKIPADKYNILPFDTSGYPDGMFSIALAFEYGVGIVGMATNNNKSWDYNIWSESKSSKGRKEAEWYLPKKVFGSSGVKYSGYVGFEIYRKTADEINRNINSWVKEFIDKERGV